MLFRLPHKTVHAGPDRLDNLLGPEVLGLNEGMRQALFLVLLALVVHGLNDPVGVGQDDVIGLQGDPDQGVLAVPLQADGQPRAVDPLDLAAGRPVEHDGVVAGVGVFHQPLGGAVGQVGQGGKALNVHPAGNTPVDPGYNLGGILFGAPDGVDDGPDHHHDQAGRHTLAGYVADDHGELAAGVQWNDVVVVPGNPLGRPGEGMDHVGDHLGGAGGQEFFLDGGGNADFPLDFLFFQQLGVIVQRVQGQGGVFHEHPGAFKVQVGEQGILLAADQADHPEDFLVDNQGHDHDGRDHQGVVLGVGLHPGILKAFADKDGHIVLGRFTIDRLTQLDGGVLEEFLDPRQLGLDDGRHLEGRGDIAFHGGNVQHPFAGILEQHHPGIGTDILGDRFDDVGQDVLDLDPFGHGIADGPHEVKQGVDVVDVVLLPFGILGGEIDLVLHDHVEPGQHAQGVKDILDRRAAHIGFGQQQDPGDYHQDHEEDPVAHQEVGAGAVVGGELEHLQPHPDGHAHAEQLAHQVDGGRVGDHEHQHREDQGTGTHDHQQRDVQDELGVVFTDPQEHDAQEGHVGNQVDHRVKGKKANEVPGNQDLGNKDNALGEGNVMALVADEERDEQKHIEGESEPACGGEKACHVIKDHG